MGVFSKYHRFREAGEEANVNNVERFGNPAFSSLWQKSFRVLYSKEKQEQQAGIIRFR